MWKIVTISPPTASRSALRCSGSGDAARSLPAIRSYINRMRLLIPLAALLLTALVVGPATAQPEAEEGQNEADYHAGWRAIRRCGRR